MRSGYRQNVSEKGARYARRFPMKDIAQRAIRAAVARGDMKREPCVECGSPRSQGHHPDYAKPLEVMWLCQAHHRAWHRQHGQGLNGGDAPLETVFKAYDWTGKRVGRLEVLGLARPSTSSTTEMWSCRCACGTEFQRTSVALSVSRDRSRFGGCDACVRQALYLLSTGTRAKIWAAHLMLGSSLYGVSVETRMESDIRTEIAEALGCDEPRFVFPADTSFEVTDGYDWGSAATVEILDSLPTSTVGIRIRKPKYHVPRKLTVNGETLTLREWAERVGLQKQAIIQRLKAGWSPDAAVSPSRRKRAA